MPRGAPSTFNEWARGFVLTSALRFSGLFRGRGRSKLRVARSGRLRVRGKDCVHSDMGSGFNTLMNSFLPE